MKVTLVGHYPPPFGGVAALMRQIEAALRERGCEVSIFNLGPGRPEGEEVVNFNTSNRALEFLQLARAFVSHDSDVFHYLSASYRSFWLGTVCVALARMAGRRIVVSFVGGAFREFTAELGHLKSALAAFLLRRANALISCNSEIEEVLRSLVPGRTVHRMSNCFPPCGREKSGLTRDVEEFVARHSPLVCSTGAASPEYGLLSAVAALGKLRERFANVGMVLVLTRYGDASHEEALHRAIASEGLEGHVLVVRDLPDFISLLERSDVLLRSTLADGDSVSVREALFLGVPAVASDTPFRPEGVILFRRGDPGDMAEKLTQALTHETHRPVPRFQEEAVGNLDALLQIYRHALRGKGAPGCQRRFCDRGGRVGP
ncbi:MAG: glycosyltransferase family 4 protein [Candidatus Eiseniibacteriota bacterium]|nr:MAG: glycosyltransferase family 4 protein [Candidatus Eisenbacteria bacterium]